MLLVRQPLRVIRQFTFLTMLVVAAGGCDSTNPTLAIRAEVSPSAIAAGGSDTTTIRVTVVNLTAVPVDRVVGCDNLFSVEDLSGREVVSSYRVTCPVENSVPLRIELGAFESVELTRLWTGVNVVYSGGYVTEPLPAGAYLIYGRLGELRSAPQGVDLVAP